MTQALSINAPAVVGEIIDGEAVIMDLALGHYFSTRGTGAVIWSGVAAGMSRPAIVGMMTGRYRCDPAELAIAVDRFVNELLEHHLVIESAPAAGGSAPGASCGPNDALVEFVPPELHRYTDMEELLLLDPIHDVDEVGWPSPKPPDDGNLA
ncbi:MAG: PqqD family protein [Gemmatimonadales bacterium]